MIGVYTVDSFTSKPFGGNAAGVCLLTEPVSEQWMRSVAAELRHSETAFLLGRSLRWFTPKVEVALCGHATLATAHVLYSTGTATGTIEFDTLSGTLTTTLDDADGSVTMDFPAKPATQAQAPVGLIEAMGVKPVWVGRSDFDYLIEVDSADEVAAATPDFEALGKVETRGTILTAASSEPGSPGGSGSDFVSRFFAPAAGVDEDPVTGSAHCTLSPYWSAKLGRQALTGAQLSERGGIVRTRLADTGDRVKLSGHAVTIWSGQLHLQPAG
jgi:PhzF family phenazine biosynthesis protein